ncbi:MAG: PHP domain-containing protein [Fibromonadales bacterium]|nr:PHP domain-containing protein [Fibromonadales bacterium]MCL2208493.1 PHP domain-containing protein [Fibromonadales bacterium]
MSNIDLHVHTIHSDGTLTVEALLNLAVSKGLTCISITDHDTFDAYATAPEIAKSLGVELVTGIEISSVSDGRDIHILGYFCDVGNAELLAALESQREKRKDRVKAILEKLRNLGLKLSYEQVEQQCLGASISRPHIASAMVEARHVNSFSEAFDLYLKEGAAAYCPPRGLSSEDAISLIKKSGGLAVMAHPEYTNADELIPRLVKYGIAGLEVYNYKTTKSVKKYKNIAKRHGLIETGGSDFHGGPSTLGLQKLPYSIVEKLRAKLQ